MPLESQNDTGCGSPILGLSFCSANCRASCREARPNAWPSPGPWLRSRRCNRRRLPGVRVNPGLLRLAVIDNRSAYGRITEIAGGVAVGVCLLLLLRGGAKGLGACDDRGAWLRETGSPVPRPAATDDPAISGPATAVPLTADTVLMEANPWRFSETD